MKVIIDGPVSRADLDDAELLAGIEPTSFVTNGQWLPPASHLPTDAMPICMKQPEETRERARNYSLVQAADALVTARHNPHLVNLAHSYGLAVYEAGR